MQEEEKGRGKAKAKERALLMLSKTFSEARVKNKIPNVPLDPMRSREEEEGEGERTNGIVQNVTDKTTMEIITIMIIMKGERKRKDRLEISLPLLVLPYLAITAKQYEGYH